MQAFLPNVLLEEILRDYLIIHWTDFHANDPSFPHPQHKDMSAKAFRASELSVEHTTQIQDLLTEQYPSKAEVLSHCIATLNKLHAGNYINDTSHSEFIISLTRNNVQWQNFKLNTFLPATDGSFVKITLPYNQPYEVKGMTLALPELQENSYYYIDVFVPEND